MTYPDYNEMMRYDTDTDKYTVHRCLDRRDETWSGRNPSSQPELIIEPTTKDELVRDLLAMGIENRATMIHSSYSLLKPVEGGPLTVVDAMVDAVGRGSLFLPTYDFESWTELGYWERNETPSKMGIISETARTNTRFMRSPHPMQSYVITAPGVGGDSEIALVVFEDSVSSHGAGSLFDTFIEDNGLLISIGADHQKGFRANDVGFTICTEAALRARVPWRKMKVFKGVYVDGEPSIREYASYVNADPSRYVTEVTPGHLEAERQGIIKRYPIGNTEAWVADAKTFVDWAVESHKTDPGLWRREL